MYFSFINLISKANSVVKKQHFKYIFKYITCTTLSSIGVPLIIKIKITHATLLQPWFQPLLKFYLAFLCPSLFKSLDYQTNSLFPNFCNIARPKYILQCMANLNKENFMYLLLFVQVHWLHWLQI